VKLTNSSYIYALALIFGLGFWSLNPFDPDLGWHLLGGRWILNQISNANGLGLFSLDKIVPQADFINSFRSSWHDYHWLGQILIYRIYALGGIPLLRFSLGLLGAYLAKLLCDIALLSTKSRLQALALGLSILAALELIKSVSSIRPVLIVILFLALALRRLLKTPNSWEIGYLFFLSVLACNIHVYWIFFVVLWCSYRVLPYLLHRSAQKPLAVWGGFFALLLSGLFSPYGLFGSDWSAQKLTKNYALIFDYLHTPSALSRVAEFTPALALKGYVPLLILAITFILGATYSVKRWYLKSSQSVSIIIAAALALLAAKFLSIFAVFGLPHLAQAATRYTRRAVKNGSFIRYEAPLAAVLFIYGSYSLVSNSPWLRPDSGMLEESYPLKACASMTELKLLPHNARNHLRVLTHFNFGGWCRFAIYNAAPDLDARVTTDGRTQGVPTEHFSRSFDLYDVKEGWVETLNAWAPDIVLAEREHSLANVLLLAANQWRVTFKDDHFIVFARVAPSSS